MAHALELSDFEPGVSDKEAIRPRLTVSELVAEFEDCEHEIRESFTRVAAARERLGALVGERVYVHQRWSRVDFDDPDGAMLEVRRQIWHSLVHYLDLPRLMSVKAWKDLQKQIQDGEPPEINDATVSAMLKQFHQKIPEMLQDAVKEVFEFLRPWRGDRYKTNQRYEIGERVVLENMVERDWQHSGKPRINYHREPQMMALERVFQALDGQGAVNKTHKSGLQTALQAQPFGTVVQTKYFEAKAFRKGTMHLKFRRLDLLKKLNQIAGGKNLRGGE